MLKLCQLSRCFLLISESATGSWSSSTLKKTACSWNAGMIPINILYIVHPGVGLLFLFWHSFSYKIVFRIITTTFIFGSCYHSWVVLTPVTYELDIQQELIVRLSWTRVQNIGTYEVCYYTTRVKLWVQQSKHEFNRLNWLNELINTLTKWSPFRRGQFQVLFLELKRLNFKWNFTEICSSGSYWQHGSIGSDNGLAPNRRQAIVWNNADIYYL